jgi:copper(I)-binding protein
MRAFLFAAVLVLAACGQTSSLPETETPAPDGIELRDAWAAPTPNGVDVSAGYLVIANGGGADRLIAVASARAERVEIHEMIMDGAIMQMRPVEALNIPANGQVELAPGGQHLMFFGVTEAFAEGQEIPVQLTFESAGEMDVMLPVRRAEAEHGGH